MTHAQTTLRLVAGRTASDETTAAWVRELVDLASTGTPCSLELVHTPLSHDLDEACRAAGIEVTQPSPSASLSAGLLVVVVAAAGPGPRVLRRLAEAARATSGALLTLRQLPLEDLGGRPVAVAVDGAGLMRIAEAGARDLGAAGPAALLAAARAADLTVEPAPAATVLRELGVRLLGDDGDDIGIRSFGVRTAELVLDTPPRPVRDPGEDPRPTGHPAALDTSIARLLVDIGVQRPEPDTSSRPFLSVVTRTQGRRLQCLAETMACLATQTVRDFEVLLACHQVDEADMGGVLGSLGALPGWLSDRVRVIRVDRPGRAAPLNDAFAAAEGRYAVILDDDDTVLPHWVETFHELERRHPGRVLRSVAVRQDVVGVDVRSSDGTLTCPVATTAVAAPWPGTYRYIDHLVANYSPCMTVAFPRGLYADLGQRFDEDLHTTEDWEYLVRASSLVGVANAREVTSVYRWWVGGDSSRALHDDDAWDRTREEILDGLGQRPLVLPPGSVRRVDELNQEIHHAWREIGVAAEASHALNERLVGALAQVDRLQAELARADHRARRQRKRVRRLRRRLRAVRAGAADPLTEQPTGRSWGQRLRRASQQP